MGQFKFLFIWNFRMFLCCGCRKVCRKYARYFPQFDAPRDLTRWFTKLPVSKSQAHTVDIPCTDCDIGATGFRKEFDGILSSPRPTNPAQQKRPDSQLNHGSLNIASLQGVLENTLKPIMSALAPPPPPPTLPSCSPVILMTIDAFFRENLKLDGNDSAELGRLMSYDESSLKETPVHIIAEIFKYDDLKCQFLETVRPFFENKQPKWLLFQARLMTISKQIN